MDLLWVWLFGVQTLDQTDSARSPRRTHLNLNDLGSAESLGAQISVELCKPNGSTPRVQMASIHTYHLPQNASFWVELQQQQHQCPIEKNSRNKEEELVDL